MGKKSEESRNELLKSYLKRLGTGEDLETVRADFANRFADVEAGEIMQAEQEIMQEGTPLEEVQKLCDLHSALFHGATEAEQVANGGATEIQGHPLSILKKENSALVKLLAAIREKIHSKSVTAEDITELRQVVVHYAKKGDLLYPHLKVQYDITGPSNVMWTVDDEIRDALGSLAKAKTYDAARYAELETVINRIEEMIYKEQNILFPLCAEHFARDEWYGIYQDAKDYAVVFGVGREIWEEAELFAAQQKSQAFGLTVDSEIMMPGGHMNVAQLTALLNTIPLEISFIDDKNINRFFNEGPKVFKRPGMAIDREVFSCHPPKIEPMVRNIIESFRDGTRDSVPVWMEKNGRTMLVTYMAVRDQNKNYLGTMELVQDMEFAKEHFEKQ